LVYAERKKRMWISEVGRRMMGERGVNEKEKSGKGNTPKSGACDNNPGPSQTGASHARKSKTGRGYSFQRGIDRGGNGTNKRSRKRARGSAPLANMSGEEREHGVLQV
jgi:hypothetical protein